MAGAEPNGDTDKRIKHAVGGRPSAVPRLGGLGLKITPGRDWGKIPWGPGAALCTLGPEGGAGRGQMMDGRGKHGDRGLEGNDGVKWG